MFRLLLLVLRVIFSGFQARRQLLLEDPALRHQLTELKHSAPRPILSRSDRLFWVLLQRGWSDWPRVLLILQPRTVVSWHRLGFRLFWRWKSRTRAGRPSLDRKLVALINQM